MRFVDTSILLYAVSVDTGEATKAASACALLNQTDLALSVQVLQEFYVQATRPSSPSRLAHSDAAALIASWLRFPVQATSVALVTAALAAKDRWAISYWDAAIVEAARMTGCSLLLTEDLQDGQDFGGVRVHNPLAASMT
jgi:predicted nucleic acid-binding protein